MHKRLVNELRLTFHIKPQGPLLIKSGQESGANPTLLDMNFVRTTHARLGETVYLPGSSLKGALRSYCEKIGRTVGLEVCDPLDMQDSCGRRLEYMARTLTGAEIYQKLCPICRIFGHTVMASHLHVSDAYPSEESYREANMTEVRDGVAIDRISGSVAVGPFQLEIVTRGEFVAHLALRNFQLWHVGLLALALRDLSQGRVPLGFARSRGLGRVGLDFDRLEISYPGQFLQTEARAWDQALYGVTTFVAPEAYGFSPEAPLPLPVHVSPQDDWGRVSLVYERPEEILALLHASVAPWRDYVEGAQR